ncbi:MAG: hypothetical protein V4587_15860, partial [Acidobacteriota bacterium]
PLVTIEDSVVLDKVYFAMLCYKRIMRSVETAARKDRSEGLYARLYALLEQRPERTEDYAHAAALAVANLKREWEKFIRIVASSRGDLCRSSIDAKNGATRTIFNQRSWIGQGLFKADVAQFFGKGPATGGSIQGDIFVTRGDFFE